MRITKTLALLGFTVMLSACNSIQQLKEAERLNSSANQEPSLSVQLEQALANNAQLQQQLQAQKRDLKQLQLQNQELQAKLDALTAIETNLHERKQRPLN